MRTPTIETIKEKYKDTKEVKCIVDNKVYAYYNEKLLRAKRSF